MLSFTCYIHFWLKKISKLLYPSNSMELFHSIVFQFSLLKFQVPKFIYWNVYFIFDYEPSLLFFIFILLSYIILDCSFLSFLSSQHIPLFPLFLRSTSPSFPLKRAGLPKISTKCGISIFNKTRHILSYYEWIRQTSRRKTVLKAVKRSIPIVGSP